MDQIINALTEMDSALMLLVFGGLLGLIGQRAIGIFVKPNYYTRGKRADS